MKKLFAFIIMFLFTLTISPKTVEASWWNPFTWFITKIEEKTLKINKDSTPSYSPTNNIKIDKDNFKQNNISTTTKLVPFNKKTIKKIDTVTKVSAPTTTAKEGNHTIIQKPSIIDKNPDVPVTINTEQKQNTPPETYSELDCINQKKTYLPEVESMYKEWWNNFQLARSNYSCYDNNSVPYCDKGMSDINIEWQDKANQFMKTYQSKLSKCSYDKKRFSDISTIIPNSY